MQAKIAAIQEQMQEALVKSELLAEQGDIDGSQLAATQAENLKVSCNGCVLHHQNMVIHVFLRIT